MWLLRELLIATILTMYLMINKMIVHSEEKNENKYLVLDDVNENKEVLKKTEEVWDGIKREIETINSGKKNWIWERIWKI